MKHKLVSSKRDPQMRVLMVVGGLAVQFESLDDAQIWAAKHYPNHMAMVHEKTFYPLDSMATIFVAPERVH